MNSRFSSYILLFLLALLFSAGCRKDKNGMFSITGRITDQASGHGVETAKIRLSASKIQTGVYNSNFEDLFTVFTNVSGDYSAEVKLEKTTAYRLNISKEDYFEYSEDISPDKFLKGENYIMNYNIIPVGYIKLRAVNISPYDSNDLISYRFTDGYMNCNKCCNNNIIKAYGTSFDSTFVCKAAGGSQLTLTWNVIKNNQSSYTTSTINCPAFDTVYFQISY